ncbi:glycoside hydrolase family 28 protein [Candidatus Enterococcus clewellii]|uniref:Pectate lyase superfamily protein domain-containing protein n=1 Tax=Candidatus Enterococcus clewellii TaxID=1834193 RepID=A0A242KDK4_9ENTE|nr:glycosyl hydrolase family 28 protein [Enterococcus sp. 9E7_DIV0242]OTP18868.1 hypothetical protein A5888_000682 [Enterococcus sp. 9E7_DIV0242]
MRHVVVSVHDFGAISSTEILQTQAIQSAIDWCVKVGGGEVRIPEGNYLIGSLRLYSNITLYLEKNACLIGSKNKNDYEDFNVPTTIAYLHDPFYKKEWHLPDYYFYGMITAFQEENITIIGESGAKIDGQDTFDANGEEQFRGPMGIIMSGVKNLKLEGYTFQNSANWSHTLDGCDGIEINGLTIKAGHDGFNFHHSQNIQVSDCIVETGDDCFAGYDIKNLVVRKCQLNTACNSLRLGGQNLSFEGCTFLGPGKYPHLSENSYYTHAFFKFYSIDADMIAGQAENISICDCKIDDAEKLFVYDYGKKTLMQNHVPLKSLTIRDTTISNMRKTSIFKGNGEQGRLIIQNSTLDHPSILPFLEIDDSIELEVDNVDFMQETTIICGSNRIICEGVTTFKWSART